MKQKKNTRSSTKFTFYVGYALVVAAILTVGAGFFTGAINAGNIVELVWALLLSAAAFLGINLSRVAAENITTIKSTAEVSALSQAFPESTTMSTPLGNVQIDQNVPQGGAQADLPVGDIYNENIHR